MAIDLDALEHALAFGLTSHALIYEYAAPHTAVIIDAAPALIAEHRALLARVAALEGALTEAIELVEKGDLDDQMCCDGHMCGCQGSTVGEQFLYFAKLALEPKP